MRFSYKNSEIEKYNQAMKDVATECSVGFIDLLPEIVGAKWNDMLRDGVHPNDEGHELIYQIVRKELEKQGII